MELGQFRPIVEGVEIQCTELHEGYACELHHFHFWSEVGNVGEHVPQTSAELAERSARGDHKQLWVETWIVKVQVLDVPRDPWISCDQCYESAHSDNLCVHLAGVPDKLEVV